MTVIIITGTPGTGKTSLAQILSKELGFKTIKVKKMIEEKNLCEAYDRENQCKIVDLKKLKPLLVKKIKESKEDLVIESHLSHHIPKQYVDLCLVTKTEIKTLHHRLKKRDYSKNKIRDNLDAEIFDLCLTEAQEAGHNIMIVDTTRKINKGQLINRIKQELKLD